ncbi:MAG: PAS domain-containing protein [Timaviella obliquedivisa GSE-PSE-MK23-08B]|jgi:two-component system CheB/CheR fusion protein|nr:PAS domain-containing protein [Timaviella obliquedivisa GSE-PSE-MK23-08B]
MNSDQSTPEELSDPIATNLFNLDHATTRDAPFPIVAIAASAGGLEAFTQLLSHLPIDTGMAFVLIQHLDPAQKSLLTEILARTTTMPVSEAVEGIAVKPNEVYIIPPNKKMLLTKGVLRLTPREKTDGKYMPGDAFFISLAADRGNKAIAVVLSGADGDGSLGLTVIKAAGGVTFAQCEATAKFESMPNTAVATGKVDFVLPPQAIAQELATLSRSPFLSRPSPPQLMQALPEPGDALATIFTLLLRTTGVDFSLYKPNTIDRRMQRRMLLYRLERLEDYAQYLQEHPAEVQALYEEILIHVTSFFRDPQAFQALKERVFPSITRNKLADPIRIWVAGCSTGEEVYSIAICLLEFLSEQTTTPPIQIFATDISETAIGRARAGVYLENQMLDVSPERRQRFFILLEDGSYRISKAVRELCIFARQNLGSDPPFSNLDLISCRNVMIYLAEPLQKRVMPIFHYSLNSGGFLMLGTSESVGKAGDLFLLVEQRSKIYAKKLTATNPIFSFTTSPYPMVKKDEQPRALGNSTSRFNLQREIDQMILNRYAPVGVVVNDQMEILQLRGDTTPYLKLAAGAPNLNLLAMVDAGLSMDLRTAIFQAQTQNISVRQAGIQVELGDPSGICEAARSRVVNLEVIPIQSAIAESRYFLVLFEEAALPIQNSSPMLSEGAELGDWERENIQLRQALATTAQEKTVAQAYLQAMIQEQEYLNQDLRVANEEILSSNEELQSTNEELQTAKEEIQSSNEELTTTNEELRNSNLELQQVNNDLVNFLASINIPILVLDNDLRIRRFTPSAQQLFNLITTDIGRPFSDIRSSLEVPNLEARILEVMETLQAREQEVQTQAGYWYTLRIRPYRTTENQINGVMIVLSDINALKQSAATIESARNYAETIVETVPTPLVILDTDLRVNTASRSFYDTFQVSKAETEQSSLFALGNGQWNIPQLRSSLTDLLDNQVEIEDLEIEHYFERIGQKTMLLNACKLRRNDSLMLLLSIEDITERKQFETERSQLLMQEQSARKQAEMANQAKDEFLSNLSHELRSPLNSMMGWAKLLSSRTLDSTAEARALEVIEQSAKAQSQLIEDLLDTSRIVSGKLRLTTCPIDLLLVVESAIAIVQLSAQAKSIQIISSLNPVSILGDSDRLQQVLWNLLSNAIKFTPSGGRVEITLEALPTYAEIRVSDTGQGIEADLLPYIFDRFRQGDASSTKASQGLGLGLAIVRQLIELHGGTIQAESLGAAQGTTMIVRLPLQSLPQEPAPLNQNEPELTALDAPIASSSNAVLSLEGLHLLVVDDQVDTREMFQFVLEQHGAEVRAVASAKAAIAALSEYPNRYNVLISDIGMPGENGYFLIKQVRSLSAEAGGQIPAVALTGYAGEQERQMAIEAGFQAHIAKPVDPDQLVMIVARLTGRA